MSITKIIIIHLTTTQIIIVVVNIQRSSLKVFLQFTDHKPYFYKSEYYSNHSYFIVQIIKYLL